MELTEIEEIEQLKEKCIQLMIKGMIGDSVEYGSGAISLLCTIVQKAKVAIINKDTDEIQNSKME